MTGRDLTVKERKMWLNNKEKQASLGRRENEAIKNSARKKEKNKKESQKGGFQNRLEISHRAGTYGGGKTKSSSLGEVMWQR